MIKVKGLSLCIRASVETIFQRLARKRDERPLLAGLTDEACVAKIESMLKEREEYYARASTFVTSDEVKSPEDMAVEALNLLKALK